MFRIHFFHRWAQFSLIFLFLLFTFSSVASAQSPSNHYTLLINQVRGGECCSAGGLNELRTQIETSQRLELPTTFTVRYDTLRDASYLSLLSQAKQSGAELGGFLEITPQLASDSGVPYTGTSENWYEAQHVYLIGYSPENRIKILDTYMSAFYKAFGTYPKTTTAWIIDTPSLQYLHEKYGVEVHQITREQWGTDSYTMWGGPPHFPYFPSEKWAFMPAQTPSDSMPIIVRQTISDPVWNYGDTTNSYTSQPNDYGIKNRGFDYFLHLFHQAHNQNSQPFTFALLGLENSMPEADQTEYVRQLETVKHWSEKSENTVVTGQEFGAIMLQSELEPITIHRGNDIEQGPENQAWWITTPQYRARLRYNAGTLYLSDLRLYDTQALDPYTTRIAEKLAYWVTPFVLDGARFWQNDPIAAFHRPHTDQLTPRKKEFDLPSRIVLAESLSSDHITLQQSPNKSWYVLVNDKKLISFDTDHWTVFQPTTSYLQPLKELLTNWQWTDKNGTFTWGFTPTKENNTNTTHWYAFTQPNSLEQERENRYPYLYPEVRERALDLQKTYLLVTNAFAQAGRNPIRLAFFPRDSYDYPTYISQNPTVTVDSDSVNIEITTPSGQDGLVFIDLTSGQIQKTTVQIQYQDYTSTHTVTFAPNCKQSWKLCLQNPHYWWWYLQNWSGDAYRQWQEKQI